MRRWACSAGGFYAGRRMPMPNTRSGSIEVLHLSKQFLQRETGLTLDVLNDISFCAEPGTFLALVGESGCGKTTLLRILAGLECADHGIVQINGKAVSGPNADCGMMFQQNALFPWLTVRENIEFGPKMLRKVNKIKQGSMNCCKLCGWKISQMFILQRYLAECSSVLH